MIRAYPAGHVAVVGGEVVGYAGVEAPAVGRAVGKSVALGGKQTLESIPK